jgi:hypothetical protein
MIEQKSALQRLAFKIAEHLNERFWIRWPGLWDCVSTDELYHEIYRLLPSDMERYAIEQEDFDKRINGELPKREGPSPVQKLREALGMEKPASLRDVIEAAIKAANERDLLLQKEQHGCCSAMCEECDG